MLPRWGEGQGRRGTSWSYRRNALWSEIYGKDLPNPIAKTRVRALSRRIGSLSRIDPITCRGKIARRAAALNERPVAAVVGPLSGSYCFRPRLCRGVRV